MHCRLVVAMWLAMRRSSEPVWDNKHMTTTQASSLTLGGIEANSRPSCEAGGGS